MDTSLQLQKLLRFCWLSESVLTFEVVFYSPIASFLSSLWFLLFSEFSSSWFGPMRFCPWSVTKSCPTLCHPMDCSRPGFPVYHQLPELTQTHVPLSRWCHPPVVCFSSCLQSFPASGSFKMSQFFTSGGHSIGVSVSTSVLPMNIPDWFLLGWTGWISLLSKGLSRVFNTTVQKHQFFSTQLSLQSNSHIHTWLLEKPWLWLDGALLAK